jgi:hypothetical protein
MADGVGLSVGATNLTAVAVGTAAVTRSAVVTLFPNRPLEVGVPSENPRLTSDERGLVISDFVDRVGDPVGIVASDGSVHRGEVLLADALGAMLHELTNGGGVAGPVAVTYPAHWRPATVDALRTALSELPEFRSTVLMSDATAAVTALRDDPGLPASGLIALCDFGGSGTSISLVEAGKGSAQRGSTVRHTDFSGDLIDQAVLTHVLSGLADAGSVDVTGTSAIGPLNRLRGQCRGAKERLSTTTATSLVVDLPGHRGEVRLTRTELDDAIRQPMADFAGVLHETLDRNGVRAGELVAVASAGGGARIPLITTTLSEHFGVPVITTAQPELTSAIGGGLQAARGPADEGTSRMAEFAPPTAAAAAAVAATQMAPEVHAEDMGAGGSQALAWSEAENIPEYTPATDPYDYPGAAATDAMGGPRPEMQFTPPETDQYQTAQRRSVVPLVLGLILLLIAVAVAVWLVLRNNESTPSPSSTTATTAPSVPPSQTPSAPPPSAEEPAPPPPVTQTITRAPEIIPTEAPPPPPPPSQAPAPPPSSEAPPPPPPEQPSSPSSPAPIIPTLPYKTIPGLPFVPAPVQPPPP